MRNMLIFPKNVGIQSWLTLLGVDSAQTNSARSFAKTNFFLCRPLLAVIEKIKCF